MISTRNAFHFAAGGRTYSCRVEELHGTRAEAWWWFDVTGDRSRYAPFRAVEGESEAAVQGRMVDYYEALVARRGWIDPRGTVGRPMGGA